VRASERLTLCAVLKGVPCKCVIEDNSSRHDHYEQTAPSHPFDIDESKS